jgi:hypothetical protein
MWDCGLQDATGALTLLVVFQQAPVRRYTNPPGRHEGHHKA